MLKGMDCSSDYMMLYFMAALIDLVTEYTDELNLIEARSI